MKVGVVLLIGSRGGRLAPQTLALLKDRLVDEGRGEVVVAFAFGQLAVAADDAGGNLLADAFLVGGFHAPMVTLLDAASPPAAAALVLGAITPATVELVAIGRHHHVALAATAVFFLGPGEDKAVSFLAAVFLCFGFCKQSLKYKNSQLTLLADSTGHFFYSILCP